jgi:hypothetical protein
MLVVKLPSSTGLTGRKLAPAVLIVALKAAGRHVRVKYRVY